MTKEFEQVTSDQLSNSLDDPDTQLIDVRPVDAYNGWRLKDEKRGGHIHSARSLPKKWINYIDWLDIVRYKQIEPHHRLIIYGYETEAVESVANHFRRAGYGRISVYEKFIEEWSTDERLPMDRLPRYRHLVPPQWLDSLLRTGTASEYHNQNYVVCHAHYRNRGAYEQGHIPGAIEIDTNTLESTDTWNRRSPQELKAALEKLGITHDTTVVLYGRFAFPDNNDPYPGSSAGHLGAFRCALIMLYAGVEDVRILNGGLQSWIDTGYKTTTEETLKRPVSDFGAVIPKHPELVVDIDEAREILRDDEANLVSVRSWPEFLGEVSGYNYIAKKGRIPGAVFGNCGSDAYHMENYRNLDHTSREYHEVEELWAQAGISRHRQNAFYCGTGWRGSEAFFNAWLMGWPRVSVFDGGWFEWSADERNPYETGTPETLYSRPSV
ncbi:MAG: thiosulfate sulfurtransferase [Chitinivibrionales bacterium]|nr:thiosulfate sulfurtransferase [Chitinivibrionales bacterium]MBD3357220.1 thiosulfate sulfurtransferase [Chitinivibrionales bacterium]